jgi:hypothetical protein
MPPRYDDPFRNLIANCIRAGASTAEIVDRISCPVDFGTKVLALGCHQILGEDMARKLVQRLTKLTLS